MLITKLLIFFFLFVGITSFLLSRSKKFYTYVMKIHGKEQAEETKKFLSKTIFSMFFVVIGLLLVMYLESQR